MISIIKATCFFFVTDGGTTAADASAGPAPGCQADTAATAATAAATAVPAAATA